MTIVSTAERRPTSQGERVDRTLALLEFAHEIDVGVALEWARAAAVTEVWGFAADVPWPADRLNLWRYLAGPAWAGITDRTTPRAADTLAEGLPDEDRILLAQIEPRDPNLSAMPGELQRVAVYYDTAQRRWRSLQWTVAGSDGEPVAAAYFVEVAEDDFQLTADPELATHGLIDTTGNGDWQIVPLDELDGSVSLRRIGENTYLGY